MFVRCERCGTAAAGLFVSPDYYEMDHITYVQDAYYIILVDDNDKYDLFVGMLSRLFCQVHNLLPGKFYESLLEGEPWMEMCHLECAYCFRQRTVSELSKKRHS